MLELQHLQYRHDLQKQEVTVIFSGWKKTIMETWNFRSKAHLPLPHVKWERVMTVIGSPHIYEGQYNHQLH